MHSSYTTEIYSAIHQIPADTWNALIWHPQASPFIRHEYLLAMEQSACVSQKTGWQPCHFTVWQSSPRQLLAAMPFYLKTHSYGEYVFDWAWANAYQENGLSYYPKMLSAIPFTPVGGTRILGNDPEAAKYLLQSAAQFAKDASELANALGTAVNVVESLVKNQMTIGANAIADLDFASAAEKLADTFKKGKTGSQGILGLERWVQRHLFKEVCTGSNTHIRSLLKGRYELTLDPQKNRERDKTGGLDLYVIDANSGKTRQVQDLSGGETFLVALALALSLADVVQSIFGGIELSSLLLTKVLALWTPKR